MTLKQFFLEHPKAGLAFSGGTDSAYLLWAAKEYGCDIYAYFVKTAFQPAFELEDAKRLSQQLGARLAVIETDVLCRQEIVQNGPERCYFCKKALFSKIKEQAQKDGCPILIDGTNASDDAKDRPGMKALAQLQVRSPLRECNLTKRQVRAASKEAGLFTWDKPAYACLATRIPTGVPITSELLEKVELAEDALRAMGFSDFRVRVYHNAARIQVTKAQAEKAVREQEKIISAIKPYFEAVLLDLEYRQ